MSLGQLGIHIATVPGALANLVQDDGFDVSQAKFEPPQPKSLQEILDAFDASVGEAETRLKEMTDEKAQGRWTLKLHDKELFSKPRIGVLRSIMLNHWYHHRGQLSVYLRLLDIPKVPGGRQFTNGEAKSTNEWRRERDPNFRYGFRTQRISI